jgi:dipeptidyl aminopeptidase/acylaminoacyl peptidase
MHRRILGLLLGFEPTQSVLPNHRGEIRLPSCAPFVSSMILPVHFVLSVQFRVEVRGASALFRTNCVDRRRSLVGPSTGGASPWLSQITVAFAAALTATITMLLPSGPVAAADRGANGVIAFSHGNGQIATLSSDGGTILNPNGPRQTRPAFSPDGTRIAYITGYHLWIMNADGSKPRAVPITGNPLEDDPTWSPDATKLAYINGNDGQIYTVSSVGGKPKEITTGLSPADLKWSPTSKLIAFDASDVHGTGFRQVFTVNITNLQVDRLTSGSCNSDQPDWSPDATEIAFSTACFDGDSNIAIMPSSGGAASPVALYIIADAYLPSWSPDGTAIAFSANEGQGSNQLWEASPSTIGDDKTLTATRLTDDPGQPYNTMPTWQPVHHPFIGAEPAAGPPRTSVTLSATDFLSYEQVKVTFIDSRATKTKVASLTTSASGAFSVSVAVPSGAALGKAKFKATGVGGLTMAGGFTVTTPS